MVSSFNLKELKLNAKRSEKKLRKGDGDTTYSEDNRVVKFLTDNLKNFEFKFSKALPGVAMTMSTPRCSSLICGYRLTPPKRQTDLMLDDRPNASTTFWVCWASSRVGAMTWNFKKTFLFIIELW